MRASSVSCGVPGKAGNVRHRTGEYWFTFGTLCYTFYQQLLYFGWKTGHEHQCCLSVAVANRLRLVGNSKLAKNNCINKFLLRERECHSLWDILHPQCKHWFTDTIFSREEEITSCNLHTLKGEGTNITVHALSRIYLTSTQWSSY